MRSVPRLRGRLAGTISLLTAAVVVATTGVSAAAPSPAPTAQNSVYALANGCFALRTESGDFVRRDGSAYLTDVTKAADAEPFRLHAAQLGRFMLYGPDGSMLSHDGADSVLATSEATPSTDWTVMSTGESFVLTATSNGRQLISRDLMLTMSDPGDVPESAFTLIPRDGCADFPEAEVGANGVPGEIGPNGEVTGFIDTRAHECFRVHGRKPALRPTFRPSGRHRSARRLPGPSTRRDTGAPRKRSVVRQSLRNSRHHRLAEFRRLAGARFTDTRADVLQVGRARLAWWSANLHQSLCRQPCAV